MTATGNDARKRHTGCQAILAVHFQTLIPEPASCNAGIRIYGGVRLYA
jgi:hypothetical protein